MKRRNTLYSAQNEFKSLSPFDDLQKFPLSFVKFYSTIWFLSKNFDTPEHWSLDSSQQLQQALCRNDFNRFKIYIQILMCLGICSTHQFETILYSRNWGDNLLVKIYVTVCPLSIFNFRQQFYREGKKSLLQKWRGQADG